MMLFCSNLKFTKCLNCKKLIEKFTDYYVKTLVNHPYFWLQQVFKHVGIGAVVGALSRNLHELQNRQGSYLSIYDQPTLPLQVPHFNLHQTLTLF